MPEPKSKIIDGVSFEISQPYEAGHVLNEAEARVLNQTRSENIGNNTRTKIKEMKEAGEDFSAINAYVMSVDAEYVLTLATASSARVIDPYEREARKMARDLLREKLAETGRKLNAVPDGLTKDEWDDKVEANIVKIASSDGVLAAAKKTVDARKKQSKSLLEGLDADL